MVIVGGYREVIEALYTKCINVPQNEQKEKKTELQD